MTSISAGWGKEDDCVLVRLYLPERPDLVTQLVIQSPSVGEPLVSVNDIVDLMVGVHLAVMTEAMSFCEYLGIDTTMMFDVVSNAAGASSVFSKAFSKMRGAHWSLKAVDGIEQIQTKLVRHPSLWLYYELNIFQSNAVDKTFDLRYPLFLSSAALQEFNRQMQ